jgi:hypothetical protein
MTKRLVVLGLLAICAALTLAACSSSPEQLASSTATQNAETAATPTIAATSQPTPRITSIEVPGQDPEDLITLQTVSGVQGTTEHVIAWRAGGQLKTQHLPAVRSEVPPPGPLQGVDSVIIAGVQQRSGDRRDLGIVYDATAYGSGSPTAMFALLRLEDDQWRGVWSAVDHTSEWRSSHGRVEFPQSDLSQLVVRSDSAFGRDPLSGVLFEANAGPHRSFVDTWARQGDSYVRTSAETVPSAYATLVEFMYDLAQHDDVHAAMLTTEPALVSRARELGLDSYAGKNWSVGCADCNLQTGPISFYQGPPAVISFMEQGGQWLITDITDGASP